MGLTKLPKRIKDELEYHYPKGSFVRPSKFSNKSCTCLNGHLHHSILEAHGCDELWFKKVPYTIQHKIEIRVNGLHICNHYVDFAVWDSFKFKKIVEFVETKGADQALWIIKKRLVEALYPGIPYTVKREGFKFRKGKK